MKKLKYIQLFEIFSLYNLETLNEDNLEVKNIARQLYSWLKKNGVGEVSLSTDKINIGKDSANDAEGKQIGSRDNTAKIAYYDDTTSKQTIIEVLLFGEEGKIQEVEKSLLSSFPGLGQISRDLEKDTNSPKDKIYCLHFSVAEKTTNKGGLVGNTNIKK